MSADTTPLARNLREIGKRVRSEANIAARPGQLDRLEALAYAVDVAAVRADESVAVLQANFDASEDNIASLVAALGFETGAGGPMLEDVEDRICKLMTLAQRLVRLDDPTDSGGVEDRRTITLTVLINQARSALGIQEGGSDVE